MNLCRLCGEEKSPLDFSIELNDRNGRTDSSWIYKELIEHHTRVSIKPNKLLPQLICEDCRGIIDRFADFSSKVYEVQNVLNYEHDESIAKGPLQLQPFDELFPETIIKEQLSGEGSYSDLENDQKVNFECRK